ncbi:SMP-30/gluconolactonase/LRE family protein [Rhodoferax sp.]|uniref:SMP-30/gluconolactonase/LRE family protein n=1 Tax=Rhodoferax sp. TaxID=50421 RepID=UPI00261DFCD0|nr:SMP-30/gluconolactonase/LRE family protein [Rhodoferax sp.]MDD2918860.1 SMP-30/gluconolactonase/LRE family protein [Rhodoferax sp.]
MTTMPQFIESDSVTQALQSQSWRPQRPSGARRLVHALAAVAVAGLAAVLGGCASDAPIKEAPPLVWPAPPETARIKFLRTLVDDSDLNQDTTASRKVLNFLAGEMAAANRIVEPMGLAVSDDGHRVYVSDFAQGAVFVFDFEKKTSLKIGAPRDPLGGPMSVALDGDENIYVAEAAGKGVQVFDRTGKKLHFITDKSIERPIGVAVDKARGKLYVADTGRAESFEHTIKVFDLQGKLLSKIGKQIGDVEGSFLFPTWITLDAQGNLYVSDTLNSRIQKFDPDGKFLRVFGKRGNSPGQFDKPKGLGVDTFGNLYVVDAGWSNVQIFNARGEMLMFFAGRGALPGFLQNPTSLAIDKQNRIYVGDSLNHRVNVYQLINTTAEDSAIKAADDAKAAEAAKTAEPAKK